MTLEDIGRNLSKKYIHNLKCDCRHSAPYACRSKEEIITHYYDGGYGIFFATLLLIPMYIGCYFLHNYFDLHNKHTIILALFVAFVAFVPLALSVIVAEILYRTNPFYLLWLIVSNFLKTLGGKDGK